MKQAFALMVAAAAALSGCAITQEAAQSDVKKVVIQVSDADPKKWNLALNNARNVQTDLGRDKVTVEIVAYGPGLGMLKADSPVAPRLAQALDGNVGLLACENTMTNTKTTRADMYGGIGYVTAGVVHIMQRQREGWSYIRP
jgi:intracellular sulfur oxidation DsrE/DsrF family protein